MVGRLMRLANARPNALAIQALALQPGHHVLEVGCGPGHGLRLLCKRQPRALVHGLDRSAAMIAQAQAANRRAIRDGHVRLYHGRFERLPFESATMDAVLAVNVAYFWQDAPTIVGEIRRVLRPGGRLSLYVTDAETMRRWPFAEAATHRHFDPSGLRQTLEAGGFETGRIAIRRQAVGLGVLGLLATADTPDRAISSTMTSLCDSDNCVRSTK